MSLNVPQVLIIDDEIHILRSVRRLLLSMNVSVVTESFGQTALARLERGERFDVILCDLGLPDISGEEVLSGIERIAPSQADAVVIMTGGAVGPSGAALLERLGEARVLRKPFAPEELRGFVDHHSVGGELAA